MDGTGAPAFRADVGIIGEDISQSGDLSGRSAETTIDASGLVVSPGFIDVHTHVDGAFERPGWSVIANYLAQGVTTVRPAPTAVPIIALSRRRPDGRRPASGPTPS